MASRTRTFWREITDGVALGELWTRFQTEARVSYRLYSSEVDWTRGQSESRWQRGKRVARGLFWAMVSKLSPARRLLFVTALVLLFFPGFDLRYRDVEAQMPNLAAVAALLLLVLVALELADRVTMKRDLEIAKEIQSWLMPVAPPSVPGLEIAFATRPANTVAGDYYDAFLRPAQPAAQTAAGGGSCGETFLFMVADVAGKSVPAALLMATLRASFRTLAGVCSDLVELMERLNRYACEQNVGGQRFTTVFLAEFDPLTRRLGYINAGHNWPVLRHVMSGYERLEAGGLPIGLMPAARYSSGQTTVGAGDLLVIFTDGLVEAENGSEEEFGEARMLSIVQNSPGKSAPEVLQNLMSAADAFAGAAPQHDDITCMILRGV